MLILPGGRMAATLAYFLMGFGIGPVFPNISFLTPGIFGPEKSPSIMGTQMAVGSFALMVLPIACGIPGRYVGMWIFPIIIRAVVVGLQSEHLIHGHLIDEAVPHFLVIPVHILERHEVHGNLCALCKVVDGGNPVEGCQVIVVSDALNVVHHLLGRSDRECLSGECICPVAAGQVSKVNPVGRELIMVKAVGDLHFLVITGIAVAFGIQLTLVPGVGLDSVAIDGILRLKTALH